MAFWNWRERRSNSGLSYPQEWMFDAFGAVSTASGQRVNVKNALGLAPVYAAVSIIAEHVGQVPFKVYRTNDAGESVEVRTHPAWRLLHDRPNSFTPAGRFWSTVAAHLLLYGNAFIEKVGRGSSMELVILPPEEVTVRWWPLLREKTFEYRPSDGRQMRELDSTDLLHIMDLSLDGIIGLSVISACKATLGTALAREEFEGTFYKNGAVLSQVVEMDKSLKTDAALKRMKVSLQAIFGGSGKSHQIAVFEDGAHLKQVGSPLKDLQFVESQNMTATQLAVMFKLPPNALGGSSGDSLHYSTVEMNQQQIAVNAVAPVTHTIAQAVSQDPSILPQNIFYGEFVLEGMMRGDAKTRAEVYEKLVAMKAMLPEEVRTRENLPPLTQKQKDELNPPAPPAPASGVGDQQQLDVAAALATANGNGSKE